MNKQERIRQLVQELNEASERYYGGAEETMSNYEWDGLFDELTRLEEETGLVLPDSPTHTTSHAEQGEASGGTKEPHEYPALSLAKTKKVTDLQAWAGELPVWLSWKLDGLTLVLTYDEGKLQKILTRGNGLVGTNITYMKTALKGFPLQIDYQGHLVVRGEAVISYEDFETINDTLDEKDEKYANPRNLACGTLALDVSNLAKVRERKVNFYAFTLVHIDKPLLTWGERMEFLETCGFSTVAHEKVTAASLPEAVERWTHAVESGEMPLPVDGLVISYDDIAFAATGSVTGHHATRAGYAFKWADVSAETTLDHIEWSCAASTITPVAVFDTVLLEGTEVSRASLCNISELERLGIGENRKTRLQVIKANKIIPKCVSVVEKEGRFSIPAQCPVCGSATELHVSATGTKTLRCTNAACPAKHLKKFARFVSKAGMDIDGLSIQTLRVFVNQGYVADFADLYHLEQYAEQIKALEGFGEKSCANLLRAIEKSRAVHPVNLLFALCIPMIGVDAGKKLIAALGWQGLLSRLSQGAGFEDIDGIGAEKSSAVLAWYAQPENQKLFFRLLQELQVEDVAPTKAPAGRCAGLTFVITGDVQQFPNRAAFKAYVERQGGKVTSSVSKKTSYLVNNDTQSTSNKNKKAQELGVPVLSEQQFVEQFGIDDSDE